MAETENSQSETILDDLIYEALNKLEQNRAEFEKGQVLKERQRRLQYESWKNRILESSFNGDAHDIKRILKEVSLNDDVAKLGDDEVGQLLREQNLDKIINCQDANNNSPLSEAAAGGSAEVIKLLIQKGAHINHIGSYGRTPLYRAAFCGHLEACQVLLSNGADPRIYADDGSTPQMIASTRTIQELFQHWDISITDTIRDTVMTTDEKAVIRSNRLKEIESEKLKEEFDACYKEWKKRNEEVLRIKSKLLKKIRESELGQPGRSQDVLELEALNNFSKEVKELEMYEEMARVRLEKIEEKFTSLKIKVPETDHEISLFPGEKVNFRDLDEVVLKDSRGIIAASGKWPLLIDGSNQTGIFLRYYDSNFLDAYIPNDMEPEKIRIAIVGAIRYGKPAVLDLQGSDMFDAVSMKFDRVLPQLMNLLLSKKILENERYMMLVRPSDGGEFSATKFLPWKVSNFKFILLTKLFNPPASLLENTCPFRVVITTHKSSTHRISVQHRRSE